MLTHLHFKNWRSLRDVTVDNLTPITVFIGPNSSGKTNIADGLFFVQDVLETPMTEQVMYWRGGYEKIHFAGTDLNEPIGITLTFNPEHETELTYSMQLENEFVPLHEVLSD